METNDNIEKEIERTLGAAKNMNPADVSPFFTEKTMQRIRSAKQEPFFSATFLLKAAAVLILICLNVYTIKYVLETPGQIQPQPASATIDDLVDDYQVSDNGNDLLNNKIEIQHEQPEAH
ncbi:MAG: hypothetical protein ACLQQ4_07530 [Bacteroidia bacterium]